MSYINASISSGNVPTCFKSAVVTPLNIKKPNLDHNTLKNYRPVSNLSFPSKVLERIVADQLNDHITRSNLADPMQSAYQKGHSCDTALLRVKNDTDMALDRGEGTLLLLNLSAAFDTVHHDLLLARLSETFGVKDTALAWFHDYLTGRTQVVSAGCSRSQEYALTTGVPQGSVLGPILFLCYVQPLVTVFEQHPLL